MKPTKEQLLQEFDRQVETLIAKGYPQASGVSKEKFLKLLSPLRQQAEKLTANEADFENGTLPFVIVVTSELVPAEKAMSMIEREGKQGLTKLYPLTPVDFHTIDQVTIPNTQAYLLIDIDRGKSTINIRPNEALTMINKKGRSPLTIAEGIAIVTHYPDFLKKNNCFSLLASRHTGDQRVPAIWINGEKRPNLGWCWNGNPHTWLGSASCSDRIG